MLFEAKKLEMESAEDLFQCRVSTVKPFALMMGPVYVFMKRNQKFVSVKAPLDFFTPEELSSLARYEEFFLPKSVSEVTPFQTAARVTRELIRANQNAFPPAPYEISNQVIQTLASIWGKESRVTAFCASVFTDEFCGQLDSGELLLGRESAVVKHELGLLLSGTLIFVLVHLGWYDLELLTQLRKEVYSRTIRGEEWREVVLHWEHLTRDLCRLLDLRLDLSSESLSEFQTQWSFQLQGRILRILETSKVFEERGLPMASGGFSW
jgi:hypothetical protein